MALRYITSSFVSKENTLRSSVRTDEKLRDVVIETRGHLRDHLHLEDSDLEQNIEAVKVILSNPSPINEIRLDALIEEVCPWPQDTLQLIYSAPIPTESVPASVSSLSSLKPDPRVRGVSGPCFDWPEESRLSVEDRRKAEEGREAWYRQVAEERRKDEENREAWARQDAEELRQAAEERRKDEENREALARQVAEERRKAAKERLKAAKEWRKAAEERRKAAEERLAEERRQAEELLREEHRKNSKNFYKAMDEDINRLKEVIKASHDKLHSLVTIVSQRDPEIADDIMHHNLVCHAEAKVARALKPDLPEGQDKEARSWFRSMIQGESIQERTQFLRRLLEEREDVQFSILLESEEALALLATARKGNILGHHYSDCELDVDFLTEDLRDLHHYISLPPS